MNNTDIIKTHFNRLSDQFGLTILRESYSPEIMGNAEVVFVSDKVGIQVVVDRNQVLIRIGKRSWPENEWFAFTDVLHYFAPDEEAYIFLDKVKNEPLGIEAQVIHILRVLDQYCRPLLEGDFTHSDQIRELEDKRVSEMLEMFRNISQKARENKKK